MNQSTTKKLKARDEFRRYAESLLDQPFEKLGNKNITYALGHFYVFEIHNNQHSEISEEDFLDGWVDNGKDLDIDFIHRDDGHVLIFQFRYHKHGNVENPKDIGYFQDVFSRITGDGFPPNNKLRDILATIDLRTDTFSLVYVTFADINNQALDQTKLAPQFPSSISDLAERCDWEFLDERGLDAELRKARSITAAIDDSWNELFATGPKGNRSRVIELSVGGYRSFVMVVSANELLKVYNDNQRLDSLFTLNIRNFLGNTKHNTKIIETAKTFPEKFFHFNNGISCLAKEVIVSDTSIKVRGLQVINGAQTIRGLHRAAASKPDQTPWPDKEHTPLVLVRVTEAGESYGPDGRFREEVTTYNNTQNVIKQSDFRSNDPIQIDLKNRFAAYKRLGKSVCYVPKRTDKKAPNAYTIRLEDFAKAEFAFLVDPVSFSGSTSFLFDDGQNGGYKHIFGDGEQIWEVMSDDEFRLRSGIWWLSEEFAEQIAKDRKLASNSFERLALERKYMILFVARLVLQRSLGADDYKKVLTSAYKGDWRLGEERLGEWFRALYEIAKETIVYQYAQASTQRGFVHRNWMRAQETARTLEIYVTTAPIAKLPPPPRG